MTHPRVLLVASDPEKSVAEAVRVLKGGGVVALPTETVYGVAVDAAHPTATERLYEIKGRDRGKPLQLLAPDIEIVKAHGAVFSAEDLALAEEFWAGPLTLVLRVRGEGQAVKKEGFRVPDHEVAMLILRALGGVLRATSANLSGDPPAKTAADVADCLGHNVDMIIDDGPVPGGVPSTVAETVDGALKVLREGAISAAELKRAISKRQE